MWIEQELRYSRKRAFTLGKGCNQVLPTSILIMYTLGPQHRHQVCTQAGQTAPIRKRSSILFLAWKKIVYKVCPFGVSFSAHWWGSLGGFILRIMHRLAYLEHSGMLYVDDFIFTQDYKVLPITAAFWILFLQAICLPISWRKCELSHNINWIGWRFCFVSGIIMIHPERIFPSIGVP